MDISIAFLFVSFCYYTNENVFGLLSFETEKSDLQLKLHSIGEKKIRLKRANMCPDGWTQVGASCYNRPNLTMNFTDSVNYCAANDSTLPIFYNASEYLSFENWWNTITNNTEVWLGITYDPASTEWIWLNNCTWKHFPAFWRTRWDSGYLSPIVYYAKYSNQVNLPYAPTGVEPVLNYLGTKLDVVCYQPIDDSTSGCYEFPFEKNSSFLCNTEGWWCATEHSLGQTVSAAVASDSCFCLDYDNVSSLSTEESCNNFNGTLADIRSDEEFQLIITLIDNITINEAIQDFMCPLGFSYFNGSCFTVLMPRSPVYDAKPGVNADQYCRNNLSALSASLHSFDEQWFLYHLYLTMMGYIFQEWVYLGAYKNDTSKNFTYHWNDGSPMDYIPEWGLWSFSWIENDQYGADGDNIVIHSDDGKLGDYAATESHSFACRSQILKYPVYPILVSSNKLLNKNKTISPANPAQNAISKLCRKDRVIAPSTTSITTVQGTSLVTSINTTLLSSTTITVIQTAAATSTYPQTHKTSSKILHAATTTANMCQNGWTQIGSSCYYRPNLMLNFTDSVNYCAANSSTLPIFYNASEYLSFENWWNRITNNTEVWLGLTYDPTSGVWSWVNNCTWKHFPAFWRDRWDKDGLNSEIYYAKYSNAINGVLAPTGVEPVLSSLSTNLDVVCYQSIDQSTSGCYEFPFEKNNSFLCNAGGWWCATENSLGQTVSTAVASDSCFCLTYNNSNLSPVEEPCNDFNGTLADIRSDEEIQMIITLVDNITKNTAIQDFMCPLGFSYFNESCFTVLRQHPPMYSSKPGVYADQYCRNNLWAQSASLHSFDEQWFLYHLYLTTMGFTFLDECLYLGAYKNDTSVNFTYHWNDDSPMDYIPEWGLYVFTDPENDLYCFDGVDIMLNSGDGKLGDHYLTANYSFACKSQILNYPVYPILVSSAQNNLLNKNKTFSPSSSAQNVISKLCRKDRMQAPSTTNTTTVKGTPLWTTFGIQTTTTGAMLQTTTTTDPVLQTATTNHTILQTTTNLTNIDIHTYFTTKQPTTENMKTSTAAFKRESPVNPMSETEQLIATVISTIGCTWIAATTALSFVAGAFLSRKSYSFEQKLRMIEEFLLCLAHILIATLTSRFDERIVCSITSLLLQYIFTSFFMFLTIESLQTYSIYTNVISSGQCMPTIAVCFLGFVVPGLICLPVAAFGFYELSSTFSCFVNYSNAVCLANILPILLICIISIVTTESIGMHLFEDLPMTCIFQRHSAIVSKHALVFKIPLTISSWVLMTFGLHYQKFYWFAGIFGVNVALGWVCFLSHFIGNEEIKRLWHKLMKKIT